MTLLKVNQLTKHFGGLTAVNDVTMNIESGQLVGLIGPNGAGKTTLFNLLTGVYQPSEGEIYFKSSESHQLELLNGKASYEIASLGIGRTFQNIRLFKELSVLDNVRLGMHKKEGAHFVSNLLRLPSFYRAEEKIKKDSLKLLKLFDLEAVQYEKAKNLPYGDQRKLEIVRALATGPQLLFLDEPAAGMNPQESAELNQLIKRIHEEFELTIILIEHDMSVVMNVCEKIYVLEYGQMIASGSPLEIRQNQRVIEAYLGGE